MTRTPWHKTPAGREASRRNAKAYRERRKAEGYRILHGYPTTAPRTNRGPDDPPPPHGDVRRYWSRRDPCHEECCHAAYLEYHREKQRQARKSTP